jgi:hypothetical protein
MNYRFIQIILPKKIRLIANRYLCRVHGFSLYFDTY